LPSSSIPDLRECIPECRACIKSYIKKHKLEKGNLKFEIPCRGIKENPLDEYILSGLEDPESALAILDPVIWAKKNLNWVCVDPDGEEWRRKTDDGSLPAGFSSWNPKDARRGKSPFHRPYQSLMLSCTSRRKVSRCGRQLGKCLVSGTLIHLADGTLKPVEELDFTVDILALDEDYHVVPANAGVVYNGKKEALHLILGDGRSIECSYNHPFLVRRKVGIKRKTGKKNSEGKRPDTKKVILEDNWYQADELKSGDCIAVPRRTPEGREDLKNLTQEEVNILGILITDGNLTQNNCRFTNTNTEILEYTNKCVSVFGCRLQKLKSYINNVGKCVGKYDYYIKGQGVGKPHKLKVWLRELGLLGLNSHQKHLPDFIMRLKNCYIIPLLRWMYACDGWASVGKYDNNKQIGYCTVSEKLADQVLVLLSRFGIYATKQLKRVKYKDKIVFARQIIVSRKKDICIFADLIGIATKDQKVQEVKTVALSKKPSPKTERYEQDDVVFIPLKNVVPIGEKDTWDLSVPQYHNFIANNIISHNTDCLAVSICYDIFTHKDFSVTLITPYQTQVELIFKRVLELIKFNPELYNSIKEKRKSPNFYLELYNGSTVQGYSCVASTKITTRNGLKNIEDIVIGDEVLSLDEKNNTLKYQKVTFVYEPNYKDVYKVKLNCGYEVVVSEDHPFWIQLPRATKWQRWQYSWKKLKDLKVGDTVAVVKENDLSFSGIKSITYVNKDTTYDLKVGDGTNNFIANNIVLHNTAGTKSNSGAGVVRGAHAQKLIFDEADMLSRADLDSSLALITNFPEAVVWLSSTPTGKRETFYRACKDPEYKEFHYPSSVNPSYSEELERFFRKNLTELGYVHEALAEFGEDSQGVYQKKYIEVAKMPYKYGDFIPQPGWVYSIGVDWNDVSGTVIRVVGLNPGDNSFYCVDRKIVKKEGWTQTAAVKEIVNMNRFWHPAWIYVDRGYGHAQVELLHGIGAQAMRNKQGKGPDARLAKIVKAYDFGSTVEIKDLFTKKPIKKPAKPFLVESSVRCFEDGRIKFPKDDELLTAALEGYYIVRLTESGTPKYGFLDAAVGDHDVDALNLALVAFALESGDFAKPTYTSNIDFTGYFGEDFTESMERRDREKKTQQIKEDEGGRTVYHYRSPLLFSLGGGLPAANTSTTKQLNVNKLWSWPGYLKDAPPPKRKPGGFLDRIRRGGKRGGKPSRTNI